MRAGILYYEGKQERRALVCSYAFFFLRLHIGIYIGLIDLDGHVLLVAAIALHKVRKHIFL
jgi:hypothetical protein